jgi:hypothetical protein
MKKLISSVLLYLVFTQSLWAKTYAISTLLNGNNEVPAVSTPASGQLYGTLDDASGTFTYTFLYIGLSSAITGSHFHIGEEGANGSIIQSIGATSSPFFGVVIFSPTQITDLLLGRFYVNLHTTNNPAGEIRGQLGGFEIFNNAQKQEFMNVKKHAFRDSTFTSGLQAAPFFRKGTNTFSYVASAPSGIFNINDAISTLSSGDDIIIEFKTQNVRMFAGDFFIGNSSGVPTDGNLSIAVFTNLGRFAYFSTNLSTSFLGLSTLSDNEHFVHMLIAKAEASSNYVGIDNLVLGEAYDHNLALDFDGMNDFLSIDNAVGNFNTTDPFTVEFWMQAGTQNHSQPYSDIIDKFVSGQNYPFLIQMGNTQDAGLLKVSRKDATNTPSILSIFPVNDDKWHHVAFVKEVPGDLKLYVNGFLMGSIPDNCTTSTQNTVGLYLGGGGNNSNFFKGKIDEFRVWSRAKTQEEILGGLNCKNPSGSNLDAFFNFDQGEASGFNRGISLAKNLANSIYPGVLSNFSKTGQTSNFVDSRITYVDVTNNAEYQTGYSWATAYNNLESALSSIFNAGPCNDLLEVWVANGTYKPNQGEGGRTNSFQLPAGMKLFGGFVGNETSILDRDNGKIHTQNLTKLSGDINGDDSPSNFGLNKADNTYTVLKLQGIGNVLIDGFEISGGYNDDPGNFGFGAGGIIALSSSPIFKNLRIVDNFGPTGGVLTNNADALYENCAFSGNKSTTKTSALWIRTDNATHVSKFYNCLFSGNHASGSSVPSTIYNRADGSSAVSNPEFYNCNIVNNVGVGFDEDGSTTNPVFRNSVIHGNSSFGIRHASSSGSPALKYSLLQGLNPAANGNLDGTTVNPNFENPLAHTSAPTMLGDYRLKWCSKLIDAGNIYALPLKELGNNPRMFGPKPDIGTFEYLGNAPSNDPTIDFGTNTLDVPYGVGMSSSHIISANKVWTPGGTIIFRAPNSITLNPGFEARGLGQYFEAKILPNPGCVN